MKYAVHIQKSLRLSGASCEPTPSRAAGSGREDCSDPPGVRRSTVWTRSAYCFYRWNGDFHRPSADHLGTREAFPREPRGSGTSSRTQSVAISPPRADLIADHCRQALGLVSRGFSFVLISCLFFLFGCNSARKPNSTNFTRTIDQYLEKHGQTCTSPGHEFPIDIPRSAPKGQYGLDPQLAALRAAGLVSEADTTAVVHGMLDTVRGTTPPQPVRRYQPTAEGQKYLREVPAAFGKTGGFCYGQKSVDSVVKWSEPVTADGSSRTEVTYTYNIVNLAAWAERSDIQQSFSDIRATVTGASKMNQTIGLQLTNEGWEVVGQ
jgi:hypothetical protein